jgi:hypothetical protein
MEAEILNGTQYRAYRGLESAILGIDINLISGLVILYGINAASNAMANCE